MALRTLHRALALAFGAWIVLQSLTGLVLLARDQIDRWSRPELFRHGSGDLGPQAALDAAAEVRPGQSAAGVTLPATTDGVYIVAVGAEDIYLDPATAKVNGARDVQEGFTATALRWHRRLNQQQVLGYPAARIVGWLGLGWLAVTLSGAAVAARRRRAAGWRALFRLPSRQALGRAMPLHRSLGMIIALPVAVVVLTGVRYAFPGTADKVWAAATGSGQASASTPPPTAAPMSTDTGGAPLSADVALLQARLLHPQATVTGLAMPVAGDRHSPIRADLSIGYDPARGRVGGGGNATLLLDQYDGRRLWLGRTSDLPVLRQAVTAWAPAIHTGTFGGPVSRLGLAALAVAVLVVGASGFAAFFQRRATSWRRISAIPADNAGARA